jgi:transposase-like protein
MSGRELAETREAMRMVDEGRPLAVAARACKIERSTLYRALKRRDAALEKASRDQDKAPEEL